MLTALKKLFRCLHIDTRGALNTVETVVLCAVCGAGAWVAADKLAEHLEEKADQTGEAIPTLQQQE